ncbi:unnamed protein product [Calicophoron daubneyi]|uniref:Uncharacterized protein n=1 Tax=Calicophoron daubneyi TaxID=300641 RepID=A0AAV2T524_CALDB
MKKEVIQTRNRKLTQTKKRKDIEQFSQLINSAAAAAAVAEHPRSNWFGSAPSDMELPKPSEFSFGQLNSDMVTRNNLIRGKGYFDIPDALSQLYPVKRVPSQVTSSSIPWHFKPEPPTISATKQKGQFSTSVSAAAAAAAAAVAAGYLSASSSTAGLTNLLSGNCLRPNVPPLIQTAPTLPNSITDNSKIQSIQSNGDLKMIGSSSWLIPASQVESEQPIPLNGMNSIYENPMEKELVINGVMEYNQNSQGIIACAPHEVKRHCLTVDTSYADLSIS